MRKRPTFTLRHRITLAFTRRVRDVLFFLVTSLNSRLGGPEGSHPSSSVNSLTHLATSSESAAQLSQRGWERRLTVTAEPGVASRRAPTCSSVWRIPTPIPRQKTLTTCLWGGGWLCNTLQLTGPGWICPALGGGGPKGCWTKLNQKPSQTSNSMESSSCQ